MQFCWSDAIQETCGWIGCAVNLFFFVTPVMPFVNVLKGNLNFEDSPGIYVTISYINCLCWYTYGELTFSDQMRISYIIGTIINLILLIIYLFYEIRKYIFDTIINILLLSTGTYSFYVGLTVILDDDQVAAKFCNAASLLYFFYPVRTIYKVIIHKSYHLISVKYHLISIFNDFCWSVYGVLILENLLAFPHLVNIILSLIQIYIYKIYKEKFPEHGEKDSNTLGIESNGNEETKIEETRIKEDENIENIKERPVKIIEKENF